MFMVQIPLINVAHNIYNTWCGIVRDEFAIPYEFFCNVEATS